MKTHHLFFSCALALAMSAPIVTMAQQAATAPSSQAPQSATTSTQPGAPSGEIGGSEHHHAGMMRLLRGVDLTSQQHAKIAQLMDQFHQAHPEGSPADKPARKALHDQIMAVLTPSQQAQVRANMAKAHEHPMAPEGPNANGSAPEPEPSESANPVSLH